MTDAPDPPPLRNSIVGLLGWCAVTLATGLILLAVISLLTP
ncbi:MAG: hypothetical protein AB7G11_02595 [Phycisphaerales bacterium]